MSIGLCCKNTTHTHLTAARRAKLLRFRATGLFLKAAVYVYMCTLAFSHARSCTSSPHALALTVSCHIWEGSLPFPSKRNGTQFVGQMASNWLAAISGEAAAAAAAGEEGGGENEWTCKVSPVQCRRDPEWLKG